MFRRFTFIFILFHCELSAQKPLYVSLEKYTLENVEGCHVVKVIDAREDKSNIGFTQRGITNVKTPAYFAKAAEEELQSLFSRSFSADQTFPLIIRLNYINIYEFTNATNEAAYVELNLTFITQEGNNYFERFESAIVIEDKGMTDATRAHAYNIVQAVEQSFNEFHQVLTSGLSQKKLLTENELLINPLKAKQYKILFTDNIPKCVFHSFYSFRDFYPDTSKNFKVISDQNSWEDSKAVTIKWTDDNSKIKDVWGFSDGKDVYMKIDKLYYPLTREQNDFTIYSNYISPGGTTQGAFTAGLLGGLIGGLIYSSMNRSVVSNVKCKVNFANGSLIPVDSTFTETRTHGKIYFYFTSYSQEGEITLSIDGEEQCKIQRGSYYFFRNTSDEPKISVCLKSSEQEYCEVIKSEVYSTSVYLCKIKKELPELEMLRSELESSVLADIRSGKYPRSCD